jgi:hypothetical protein
MAEDRLHLVLACVAARDGLESLRRASLGWRRVLAKREAVPFRAPSEIDERLDGHGGGEHEPVLGLETLSDSTGELRDGLVERRPSGLAEAHRELGLNEDATSVLEMDDQIVDRIVALDLQTHGRGWGRG